MYKFLFTVFIGLLLLQSCASITLIDRNGNSEKIYHPRHDGFKKNKAISLLKTKSFDINNLGQKAIYQQENRIYELIEAKDIKVACQQSDTTCLLFWYTNCPTTTRQTIAWTKVVNDYGLPHLLISLEYLFKSMDDNLLRTGYPFHSYLLSNSYGDYIVQKQSRLIQELDPDFHSKYKDDAADFHALYLDRNGKVIQAISISEIQEWYEKKIKK